MKMAGKQLVTCLVLALLMASGAFAADESTNSVRGLATQWETDSGQHVRLSDLKGGVHVISMFYATCQGVCLITKQDMQAIEASLSAETRKRTGFVLATLDAKHDTLPVLRAYRRAEHLSSSRWTLLRGDEAATAHLAELLGIAYGRDRSGRFIHSSELVVLDADGRIIARHSGLRANLAAIAKEIEADVSKTSS